MTWYIYKSIIVDKNSKFEIPDKSVSIFLKDVPFDDEGHHKEYIKVEWLEPVNQKDIVYNHRKMKV